jgi:hypothetical protein
VSRKLEMYSGRTKFKFCNGRILQFFRRSKSLKWGTKHRYKVISTHIMRSECTNEIPKQNYRRTKDGSKSRKEIDSTTATSSS